MRRAGFGEGPSMIIEYDDPHLAAPEEVQGRSTLVRRYRAQVPERARQRLALALAVAIGLGAGIVGTHRERDEQAARQRAGMVVLHASVGPDSGLANPTVRHLVVQLVNLGPLPIKLESVRLLSPRFGPAEPDTFTDRMIPAGRPTTLTVSVGPAICRQDLSTSTALPTLIAAVRTTDGTMHKERFALYGSGLGFLHGMDCGSLNGTEPPASLALIDNWRWVTVDGRPAIRGTVQVIAGHTGVTLLDIADADGFEIRPRATLPLTVAPSSVGELPVDLLSRDCTNTSLTPRRATFMALGRTATPSGEDHEFEMILDAFNTSAPTLLALDDLLERSCPAEPLSRTGSAGVHCGDGG